MGVAFKQPSRGEVWLVDLDPAVGHEQAKSRPCIILSNNSYNQSGARLVVVMPLTTVSRPIDWFIEIAPPEGGLNKISYAIGDQIRAVSHLRLGHKPFGKVSRSILAQIEFRLRILLDFEL